MSRLPRRPGPHILRGLEVYTQRNPSSSPFHAGFHAGVLVKLHDRVSLGARFLSGQEVEITDVELDTQQIATGLVTPAPLPGIPAGTPVSQCRPPRSTTACTGSTPISSARPLCSTSSIGLSRWVTSTDRAVSRPLSARDDRVRLCSTRGRREWAPSCSHPRNLST
jgi:hypothetical protein